MELSQTYKEKAEAKLAQVRADIDKLQAKAKEADANTQILVNEKIQILHEKKEKLSQQYEKLKDSSSSALETLQEGFETAWNDLSDSMSEAKKQFSNKE